MNVELKQPGVQSSGAMKLGLGGTPPRPHPVHPYAKWELGAAE